MAPAKKTTGKNIMSRHSSRLEAAAAASRIYQTGMDETDWEEEARVTKKQKTGRKGQTTKKGQSTKNPTSKPPAKTPKQAQETKKMVGQVGVAEIVEEEMSAQELKDLQRNYCSRLTTAFKKMEDEAKKENNNMVEELLSTHGLAKRKRGGTHAENKEPRMEAYRAFKDAFPELWNNHMCAGDDCFGEYVFASDDAKPSFWKPKTIVRKMVTGKKGKQKLRNVHAANMVAGNVPKYLGLNVSQAIHKVPMKLAMVVKNIPSHLVVSLSSLYGDCEEHGYYAQYVKHCHPIHFSRDDQRLFNLARKEEEELKKIAVAGKKQVPTDMDLVVGCEPLFQKAKLRSKQEEKRMGRKIDEAGEDGTGEHTDGEARDQMAIWVTDEMSGGGKRVAKNSQEEYHNLTTGTEAGSTKAAWERIKKWYIKSLNLPMPTFMTRRRATYMMDSQFVKVQGLGGKRGDTMDSDAMNKAGLKSADSELHNKQSRNSHVLMTDLVARSIYHAITCPETYNEDNDKADSKD